MTRVAQLGYLGLSVSNVNDWECFAAQILGLQAGGRDADGSLFLRMDEYHHRFIVHPTGKDSSTSLSSSMVSTAACTSTAMY